MNGSPGGHTWPAAWRMRPKLGSPPWSAVFTSGEFGHRARHRLDRVRPAASPPRGPRASRPRRRATISSASWRSRASIASPSASSSADSGSTRTPEAPFASANTVSLVESWPSTLMRSNERFTHTPVSRSSVSASSAGVGLRRSRTSWRGAARSSRRPWPAPRAAPARRQRHLEAGPLRARVARQDRRREVVRVGAERGAGGAHAAHHLLARELARRSPRSRPRPPGPARCPAPRRPPPASRRAVSSPRSPSPTFEQPEFATTARSPSSRASLRHDHGRAHARVGREARGRHRVRLVRGHHAHVEPLRLDARRPRPRRGSPPAAASGRARSRARAPRPSASGRSPLTRGPPSPAARASG